MAWLLTSKTMDVVQLGVPWFPQEPSILLGVTETSCCYEASGDTHGDYPAVLLPLSFHCRFVGFMFGDYRCTSMALLDYRDCGWYTSYHSGALPKDCNGDCSGTPLVPAPLRPSRTLISLRVTVALLLSTLVAVAVSSLRLHTTD